MTTEHSPKIETLINTIAIGCTATAVNLVINRDWYGFILVIVAMGLEFFKYWGRKKKYW